MGLYQSRYRGTRLARTLFVGFVRLYLRPKLVGREHLPERGPFILAPNHASHADTAAIYAALPRRLRAGMVVAAARDYFFANPIRRASARIPFDAIPVDRRPEQGRDPLRHAIRALRGGYGLLIYPEGTRSQDGSVGQFRAGIGRLAALFPGVPILPIWLDTAQVMPKGSVAPKPRAVHVRIGAPLVLEAQPDDRASWQAVADCVREAVLQLREQAAPGHAPAEASGAGAEDSARSRWSRWATSTSERARAAARRVRGRLDRASEMNPPTAAEEASAQTASAPATGRVSRWHAWSQARGEALRTARRRVRERLRRIATRSAKSREDEQAAPPTDFDLAAGEAGEAPASAEPDTRPRRGWPRIRRRQRRTR